MEEKAIKHVSTRIEAPTLSGGLAMAIADIPPEGVASSFTIHAGGETVWLDFGSVSFRPVGFNPK